MLRSRAELLGVLLAGCALGEGDPWGVADVELSARMEAPDGRLQDGELLTSNDFAVRFGTMRLTADSVTLEMAAGGAEEFDPTDPPPGFSGCHGGHCHADDGRIVPYDEVAAAAAGGGPRWVVPVAGAAELRPAGEAVPLELGACAEGCLLERGELARIAVEAPVLEIAGTVRDLREGDAARLPPGGLPFAGALEAAAVAAALRTEIGEDRPLGVRIDATLILPPSLLDGVAFGELPRTDGTISVADAGLVGAVLEASTERFPLDGSEEGDDP